MSVDSESATPDPVSVEDVARDLGEAISGLPAYERFEEAKTAVANDDELQAEIQSFEQKRQEFMMARQAGDASVSDVEEVKAAQRDLHSHPVMAEYLDAQEALSERLEAINAAVSEPLSVDFGSEVGGCCQD